MRHTLELGLRHYSREDLQAVKVAGGRLRIQVVGLATIAEDVTPELALATIESVTVLGALQASKAVKAALFRQAKPSRRRSLIASGDDQPGTSFPTRKKHDN
jgi:Ribbon-Helix-Helix transcriptional regulator family